MRSLLFPYLFVGHFARYVLMPHVCVEGRFGTHIGEELIKFVFLGDFAKLERLDFDHSFDGAKITEMLVDKERLELKRVVVLDQSEKPPDDSGEDGEEDDDDQRPEHLVDSKWMLWLFGDMIFNARTNVYNTQ